MTSDQNPANPEPVPAPEPTTESTTEPTTEPTTVPAASRAWNDRAGLWPALAAALAAVLGHLPVLGAWWCRDDWGLLARAAGLLESAPGFPARWLSQHAYWQATWPVFGLDPVPHAVFRLALHAASALLVVRLGRRGGLAPAAAAVAGFVFAATPLAFTPLYWAAGIQELLAATLALLAVDRWLAAREGSRREITTATLAALGSLLAKEAGLGLALMLGAMLVAGAGPRRVDRRAAVAALVVMLAAAGGAAWLAWRHFDTSAGAPYETGTVVGGLLNLAFAARWLALPGPLVDATPSWAAIAFGGALLAAWAVWGVVARRRRRRLVLAALAGSVLALAPMLPLKHHLAPYMAYLAVAGWALLLASLLPHRLPRPRAAVVAGLVACIAWGLFTTRTVLTRRNELGLPAHDIVRATSLSWEARSVLGSVESMGGGAPVRQVAILQVPVGPGALEHARRYGERWAGRTDLHEALGGDLGPRLMVPPGVQVRWLNGLVTAPDSALVLVETGTGLRPWGRTGQAALYAALTDVGLGNFERARAHILRAATLGGKAIGFACDEGLLPIPLALVTQQSQPFIDWTVGLLTTGAWRAEVGGIQDFYFNLLSACTGRSVEELTRGSRVLLPGDPPAADAPRD